VGSQFLFDIEQLSAHRERQLALIPAVFAEALGTVGLDGPSRWAPKSRSTQAAWVVSSCGAWSPPSEVLSSG